MIFILFLVFWIIKEYLFLLEEFVCFVVIIGCSDRFVRDGGVGKGYYDRVE